MLIIKHKKAILAKNCFRVICYHINFNPKKDYYRILGVQQTANQHQIMSAYNELGKKYSSDWNSQSESKLKEISEAFSVLSNSNTKKQYQQARKHQNNSENSNKDAKSSQQNKNKQKSTQSDDPYNEYIRFAKQQQRKREQYQRKYKQQNPMQQQHKRLIKVVKLSLVIGAIFSVYFYLPQMMFGIGMPQEKPQYPEGYPPNRQSYRNRLVPNQYNYGSTYNSNQNETVNVDYGSPYPRPKTN